MASKWYLNTIIISIILAILTMSMVKKRKDRVIIAEIW